MQRRPSKSGCQTPRRRLTTLGLFAAALVISVGACGDQQVGVAPTVEITGGYSLEVHKTLDLTATTKNGNDSAYTWSSSDKDIAWVSESGVVTALATGEVTITATGNDTKASGTHGIVVVVDGGGVEVAVTITGELVVKPTETIQLTAKTINGNDSNYDWSSSDEKIATVDATGKVTGVVEGNVMITAKGKDTGKSASVPVFVATTVPNLDLWKTSAHADKAAEAFNHWNSETPPEIPTTCARCHSTDGFRDYVGADGSTAFKVDAPAKVGTTIECRACHNAATTTLSQVTFPSGVTLTGLGPEARCMTCHQGRASSDTVEKAITDAALANDDTVSSSLSFVNIHYFAAGATLNGGRVRGGYQYASQSYDVRFRHVPGRDTCIGCHNPHSLKIRVDVCKTCHTNVQKVEDLKDVRMMASASVDFDGDGDITEGLYYELDGLRKKLLTAIQTYAKEQSGVDNICYDGTRYPYFLKDTNGNGTCESSETDSYKTFTPRLLRAAYNYQVSVKDPGGFAHNGKYIIQLLFDSITDLNTVLTTKVDMSKAHRNDPGHFNGAGEPARHWDGDDAVSASCSRCHGASEGFSFYLQYGVGKDVVEQGNGLDCATCHVSFEPAWNTRIFDTVTFPSGKTISGEAITNAGKKSNLCMPCHSGRESKASIDAAIAQNDFKFLNVHYLPAAAVKAGKLAQVGYEYDNKSYSGPWTTHLGGSGCIDCHKPKESQHTFHIDDVFTKYCTICHSGKTDVAQVRSGTKHGADYNGNNDSSEPLEDEVAGVADVLLQTMQTYAAGKSAPICYAGSSYPYWFKDTNNDGSCDSTEAAFANSYGGWDAKLMKAAHNYQISQKEPGAWAHNFDYIVQLLYDSIEDVGGSTAVQGLVRPTP